MKLILSPWVLLGALLFFVCCTTLGIIMGLTHSKVPIENTMNWLDIFSIISSFVAAILSTVTVFLAWRALSTWKHQTRSEGVNRASQRLLLSLVNVIAMSRLVFEARFKINNSESFDEEYLNDCVNKIRSYSTTAREGIHELCFLWDIESETLEGCQIILDSSISLLNCDEKKGDEIIMQILSIQSQIIKSLKMHIIG